MGAMGAGFRKQYACGPETTAQSQHDSALLHSNILPAEEICYQTMVLTMSDMSWSSVSFAFAAIRCITNHG
jgi:hypothetical protein